jgi:hypothetical protein
MTTSGLDASLISEIQFPATFALLDLSVEAGRSFAMARFH